jgi:hypothetical protein
MRDVTIEHLLSVRARRCRTVFDLEEMRVEYEQRWSSDSAMVLAWHRTLNSVLGRRKLEILGAFELERTRPQLRRADAPAPVSGEHASVLTQPESPAVEHSLLAS